MVILKNSHVLIILLITITIWIGLNLIPTSAVLKIHEQRLFDDGTYILSREPLYNNLIALTIVEIVRPDGFTCAGWQTNSIYEIIENESFIRVFHNIFPETYEECIIEGAVLRITRKYNFLRPSTTESIIENSDNIPEEYKND